MSTQAKQEAPSTAMTPYQKQYTGIMALLDKNKHAIAEAAAKHLDVSRLTKLALSEMRKTPDLVQCVPASVVASVMQAAQLGLEIGGPLGRCYLVPYNNRKSGKKECQLILGYKGMIELALRSGMVETVEGYPVYEGDHFVYELGLDRKLEHKPSGEEESKKLTHAYAIIRFKGGGVLFTVLTRKAIDAIREGSPGKNQKPWVEHYAEMAVKSCIRRAFKFSPASTDDRLSRAIGMEEQSEAGISAEDIIDGEIVGAAPEAVAEEPKGALDSIVDKARDEKKPDDSPIDAKAEKKPAAQKTPKQMAIKVENDDGSKRPVADMADTGPCGWTDDEQGEACDREGPKYDGVGWRCQKHTPETK
jgi:recombination protein RecT